MTAPPYPDDPHAAEAAAQQWVDDYVGRRRALDEETFGLLVSARLSQMDGDGYAHAELEHQARVRLVLHHGYSPDGARLAVARWRQQVDATAADVHAEARTWLDALASWSTAHCGDPADHDRKYRQWRAEFYPGHVLTPGECGYCGLVTP
jgi:hypothetical protein